MGIRNASILSLTDLVNDQNPDGSAVQIAEVLQRAAPIMDDMAWKRGNLLTGDRVSVRTSKPKSTWRRINKGVLPTKGASRPKDETAAFLEQRGSVDRKLAIMSGNPAEYRRRQGIPHIEGMHDDFVDCLVYGNEFADDTKFTGFMPRYNELANEQVISAGGTGTNLRSILLVGWGEDYVAGMVPKNDHMGLQHFDETTNVRLAEDGYPIGDPIEDGETAGATYLGYRDRWSWDVGLSIADPRYVVRIANIDLDTLNLDVADGGAFLEDLMIQAEERLGAGNDVLNRVNASFYLPRDLATWARRQTNFAKRTNMGFTEIGGQRVTAFGQIPVRRLDALNVDEARVV